MGFSIYLNLRVSLVLWVCVCVFTSYCCCCSYHWTRHLFLLLYSSWVFFFLIFIYLFWLYRVLVAVRGIFFFLVAACGLLVAACMWDLVPWPGIEPRPPALGAWSLTHWTTREIPWVFCHRDGSRGSKDAASTLLILVCLISACLCFSFFSYSSSIFSVVGENGHKYLKFT